MFPYEEDEEEGPSIGGGRPKSSKKPNELNQWKRDKKINQMQQEEEQDEEELLQEEEEQREEQEEVPEEAQNHESKIPSFGDNSTLIRDWTTTGLIDDPITQRDDTCGSVVFTRLLEISYNKDRPIAQRRELSYLDLANHIQSVTKKKEFSFRNLNLPMRYISAIGLHKDGKTSGKGVKTKGEFDERQNASKQFVLNMSDATPLGIIINNTLLFRNIGMGIHHVPAVPYEKGEEHALLVVARGITNDGVDFFVVQNSWGTSFGNGGYCRLYLPENGMFKIFWPV
ncbi:unnamed protein product [Cochlearia groenlandica]